MNRYDEINIQSPARLSLYQSCADSEIIIPRESVEFIEIDWTTEPGTALIHTRSRVFHVDGEAADVGERIASIRDQLEDWLDGKAGVLA